MATLVKQGFPSSPVLLREFTINGRCAVKGSARGDGKKERGETPFHRPPSHHPRALFGHAVSSSDFRRAIQIRLGLTVKPKLVENTAYKSHKKIYHVNNGPLVYRGTVHNLLFWGTDSD